jgi:Spy/CpxP family protein refolding chaperone
LSNRPLLTPLALAAALLGSGVAAVAQNAPPTPGPAAGGAPPAHQHHRGRLGRALRSLDLSDAQKAQIRTIVSNAHQAKENGSPTTRQELVQQIEGVLMPDQRRKFEAAMARGPRATAQPTASATP